jgi:hypothetical protein
MLAADVPDLQVYGRVWRGQFDGRDILADGGDGFEVGVRWGVGGFYLLEESGFAGVVEAEEEDGVFCGGACEYAIVIKAGWA